jgi:hypothetical protein
MFVGHLVWDKIYKEMPENKKIARMLIEEYILS